MEKKDKNGELQSWFSDDPDDFNSYSDYEWRIYEHVHRYNEMAFEKGKPLLWFRKYMFSETVTHECLTLLSRLNVEAVPEFKQQLQEIKHWADIRLNCKHPDDPCRAQEDHEDEKEIIEQYKKLEHSDPESAFIILHALACRGNQAFMYRLSKAYELGRGVEKNLFRALYWNDKAALLPERGDRLRRQLTDEGVTIPLHVAGIDYSTPAMRYLNEFWWEAYYDRHGLVTRGPSKVYQAIADTGAIVYPALCKHDDGYMSTEFVSLDSDMQKQYIKIAPVAHVIIHFCTHTDFYRIDKVCVALPVVNAVKLINIIHNTGHITMRDIKRFNSDLFYKIQEYSIDVTEDSLIFSRFLDEIVAAVYGDEPSVSDEICSSDVSKEDVVRHLVATIDNERVTIDQQTVTDGDVAEDGTIVINDREALCHLLGVARNISLLHALKGLCIGQAPYLDRITAFLDRNGIAYKVRYYNTINNNN